METNALTLGIDVGTGSAKGVLADVEGEFFASASHPYRFSTPVPQAAEQPPDDWWEAVCHVTRQLLASNHGVAGRLRAVGVSGQGAAAAVLGYDRKPLRDAMLWMDTRCAPQAEALARRHGETIAMISGKLPAAYNVEPKLAWIRENEPEVWSRVWKAMTTTGYINLRLTGNAVMNHSDAGILLSYDLSQHCWSEELLRRMEFPRSIFCDLASSDEIMGTVTEEAALQTGLPAGLPVVAGGEDTSSAGLAMGVLSEQEAQLSMGTASTVYVPVNQPVCDPRLLSFPHVLDGLTLTGGSMVAGGSSIRWLLEILHERPGSAEQHHSLLRQATKLAADVPHGAGGLIFLPYLAGELQPVNDGFARGVFFGLSLETSRGHLLRAVMEGTAYAVAHNLAVVRELGAAPSRLIAAGAPVENDLWCQIISDVTGLPVRSMEGRASSALGSAILAAMGAGLCQDPLTMQRAHARVRKEFLPSAEAHARYQSLFSIYQELYPRLRDLYLRLSSFPAAGKGN